MLAASAQTPHELQVHIEDVHACPGSCGGCALSAEERRSSKPAMSEATLALVERRLAEYLATLPRAETLTVTFGIADHLALDEAWLASIYDVGRRLIQGHGPLRLGLRSAVLFSTSLIGRRERLFPKLERLAARVDGVRLVPIVVLDPSLLAREKFGPRYRDLILDTKSLFGRVDLSINLSDAAVREMSAEALHDFAADHGFDTLTINWAPTLENRPRTMGDLDYLLAWLLAFDRRMNDAARIGSTFGPILRRAVNSVLQGFVGEGVATPARVAQDLLPLTVGYALQIDAHGNLLPRLEAVGDVLHSERFGFPPLGNLADAPIAELLARGLPEVTRRIVAAHTRTRACRTCDVAGYCAATGFHVVTHVVARTGGPDRARPADACPHVAQGLLRHVLAEARTSGLARVFDGAA